MEKINQMKITKNQLKQIIKEELAGVLAEAGTRAPWDTPEKARLKLDQILKDTEPKPTNGTTADSKLDIQYAGEGDIGTAEPEPEPSTGVRTMGGGIKVYGAGVTSAGAAARGKR